MLALAEVWQKETNIIHTIQLPHSITVEKQAYHKEHAIRLRWNQEGTKREQ